MAQQTTSPGTPVIERSDEILGGALVFAGTRVPVQAMLDYLEAGQSLDEFLADFPTVEREQAIQVVELAGKALFATAGQV